MGIKKISLLFGRNLQSLLTESFEKNIPDKMAPSALFLKGQCNFEYEAVWKMCLQ